MREVPPQIELLYLCHKRASSLWDPHQVARGAKLNPIRSLGPRALR